MKNDENDDKKVVYKFVCKKCDYKTALLFNWNKHIKTKIHLCITDDKNDDKKVADLYTCELCDYKTPYKQNFKRHLETKIHFCINDEENDDKKVVIDKKVFSKYTCEICDYKTKHKHNWERHIHSEKHLHQKEDSETLQIPEKQPASKHSESDLLKITTMFLESMKNNQDFQKEIISIIKEGHSTSNSNNINTVNTNSNNKQKFNLNFFLNETCKDAMNLSEFVDTLQITLADLENVGKLGYEEGISRIFTNGLKALDITKRPIHCSDVKREVVYVKNENIWVKETDQLRKAIKLITNKNIKLIPKWKEANPGHHLYHNKRNDDYLKIMYESMGPTDESEEKKSFGKIITNLAKQTTISKL
jgi:hypothetical protein